jgi:hypothetical protein
VQSLDGTRHRDIPHADRSLTMSDVVLVKTLNGALALHQVFGEKA